MQDKIDTLIHEFERREHTARRLSEQSSLQLMTQKAQEARAETWEQAIALVQEILQGGDRDAETDDP